MHINHIRIEQYKLMNMPIADNLFVKLIIILQNKASICI